MQDAWHFTLSATRLHLLHAIIVMLYENGRCYPHTENGELNRCLTRGPSLPVGFAIQDEAMDIALSASHGRYLLAPLPGN